MLISNTRPADSRRLQSSVVDRLPSVPGQILPPDPCPPWRRPLTCSSAPKWGQNDHKVDFGENVAGVEGEKWTSEQCFPGSGKPKPSVTGYSYRALTKRIVHYSSGVFTDTLFIYQQCYLLKMKAISSLQQSTKSPMRKYQHPSVNVDKTKCQVSIRGILSCGLSS